MIELEPTYEKLRYILSGSVGAKLPRNELTDKLLRALFTDEEAEIVAKGFKGGVKLTTLRKIRKRSGVSKKQLKQIFKQMQYKGTILKFGFFFMLLPYVPGTFECYFTARRDDPERLKRAGEAHYALVESGFHVGHMKGAYPFMRVIPTSAPIVKTIEINKEVPVKHEILPFEVLEKALRKQKTFAVHPCSCRTAAELSGNPCKRTDQNFCVTAGSVAKYTLKEGIGKKINLEELLEIMKKAEKAGLVHQTLNKQDASIFICQCCPCCCSALKPTHDRKDKNIAGISNFIPVIDSEKCTMCKTCIKKCTMDAISETIDSKIEIDLDLCIGCGVCASNCPSDAMTLKKIANEKPVKGLIGLYRKFKKTR